MLKLGSGTGSLVNHLQSRATLGQPEPTVGMGATILLWTDRHAGTIVEVTKDKAGRTLIGVQEDDSKVVKGSTMDGSAEYEYSRRPSAPVRYWRLNAKGFWESIVKNEETGRWNKVDGNGLRIGDRNEYRDPCF
jgi:hypothetical protein